MSHLVTQSNDAVQIIDLELLGKACTKLGLTLHTDRKVAHYYGSSTAKCDAVITIPGCTSEIAVMKKKDGTYGIEADHFYREVTKALGSNSDNLFQRYKAEELHKAAKKKGWSVKREEFNAETNELELSWRRSAE